MGLENRRPRGLKGSNPFPSAIRDNDLHNLTDCPLYGIIGTGYRIGYWRTESERLFNTIEVSCHVIVVRVERGMAHRHRDVFVPKLSLEQMERHTGLR